MKRLLITVLGLASLVACGDEPVAPHRKPSVAYAGPSGVRDLGTLGGAESHAYGINGSGVVVGTSTLPTGVTHAFRWTETAGMVDISADAGALGAAAYSVNSWGDVAGSVQTAGGLTHIAVWPSGQNTTIDLGSLIGPAGNASANAINDDGDVVGYSTVGGGNIHAFRFSPWDSTMVDLGTLPGGMLSVATSLNGAGTIVGYSTVASGRFHAFLWSETGGMMDLGVLPGMTDSYAFGISGSGQVVGFSSGPGGSHAFMWTASGGMIDLGLLPGGATGVAMGINDNGEVVGYGSSSTGWRGFIWTAADGMRELVPFAGGTSSYAEKISNRRNAVGHGETGSGQRHAIIWDIDLVLSPDRRTNFYMIVRRDTGVVGLPAAQDTLLPPGTNVPYSFALAQGYRNLVVTLDGKPVPASGTVEMGADHVLMAAAEQVLTLNPADAPLVSAGRALLTAADPHSAMQVYLNELVAALRSMPESERAPRLAAIDIATFDPVDDAAALDRLDNALAGHVFDVSMSTAGSSPSMLRTQGANLGVRLSVQPNESLPHAEPTKLFYVNGIFASSDGAAKSMGELEIIVDEMVATRRLPANAIQVKLFYNRSFGDWKATYTSAKARCLDRVDSKWIAGLLDENSAVMEFLSCLGSEIQAYADFDLWQAGRQLADLRGWLQIPAPLEVDFLTDTLRAYRDRGDHIIVVPHSQGNLMFQQAAIRLRDQGQYNPATDTLCLAAVPLAAPTSESWVLLPDHRFPVLVEGDIVPDIGGNQWDRVHTERSVKRARILGWGHAIKASLGPFSSVAAAPVGLYELYTAVGLHPVDVNYLSYQGARAYVEDGIEKAYNSCVPKSMDIRPRPSHLQVGEVVDLSVALSNWNGGEMPPRGVSWSMSTYGVVDIASTGRLRALNPGTVQIVAAISGGLRDTVNLTVDPPDDGGTGGSGDTTSSATAPRWVTLGTYNIDVPETNTGANGMVDWRSTSIVVPQVAGATNVKVRFSLTGGVVVSTNPEYVQAGFKTSGDKLGFYNSFGDVTLGVRVAATLNGGPRFGTTNGELPAGSMIVVMRNGVVGGGNCFAESEQSSQCKVSGPIGEYKLDGPQRIVVEALLPPPEP